MPPGLRLRLCSHCLHRLSLQKFTPRSLSTATATTPAPPPLLMTQQPPPLTRYPQTQPPSHKPPELRKSQLHRQYTSLLRSSPLTLLFQHSNLTSTEWMAVRRELYAALSTLDTSLSAQNPTHIPLGDAIKVQTLQTSIFDSALRVVEYWHPPAPTNNPASSAHPSAGFNQPPSTKPEDPILTHSLSSQAHRAASLHKNKNQHPLTPLLNGPLAILSFPVLSPPHLATSLSVLAPERPAFPPPTKRSSPGYWDGKCQAGLSKLMLFGAMAEGRVVDGGGVRWVGALGGVEELHAKLVGMLGGLAGGVVGVLGAAGRGVVGTLEGRRRVLEEEAGGEGKGEGA